MAFVISQELMGIHHVVSKKDKPDKRIFEVYRKFFLSKIITKKWKEKQIEADLDGEVVLFTLLPKISSIVYKK